MAIRKIKKPKVSKLPIGIENEYYAYLLKYTNNLKLMTEIHLLLKLKNILIDAKDFKDYTDKINEAILKTKINFDKLYTDKQLSTNLDYLGTKTSEFQRRELKKYIYSAVGVDIFLQEPYLKETLYAFVQNNVSLIKTISTRYFDEITQKIFRGVQEGITYTELKKNIMKSYDTSKWNAERIARDQIITAYSQLNEYRQKELGILEYVWRGMMDNRERDTHRALEGAIRKWSDKEIKPGQEILCRCWAQPVLDAFFEKYVLRT